MHIGNTYRSFSIGCLIGVALLWTGCTKEKISAPDDNGAVAVSFPFKQAAPAALNFELLVEGRDFPSQIVPMMQTVDSVFGRVDSIPVGRDRRIIVRARDPQQGPAYLYRDSSIIDIFPGRIHQLDMALRPAQPMLTVTPRYQSLLMGDTIYADVNVFNIPTLSGITFDFFMTSGPAYIASAVKGDQYGDLVGVTFTRVVDTQATISVAHRNEVETIVDASGNAHLATIMILSHQDWGPDFVTIGMKAVFRSGYGTGQGLPVEIVYYDGALLDLARPPVLPPK